MSRLKRYLLLFSSLWLIRCGTILNTPKYSFSDGYYSTTLLQQHKSKVYVDNEQDSIKIYPVITKTKPYAIDSVSGNRKQFPQNYSILHIPQHAFTQSSFDIDFLTIPFKVRPNEKSLPAQFNTNLNGAVYMGYRNDIYRLRYKKIPLKGYERQTNHYGISVGIFGGLGGTAMNQWVTEYQITEEYDGVVWSKGIAGIIGIDNFTLGLALGWDHLLDKNKKFWIYQGKPWLGLAFGLNLN